MTVSNNVTYKEWSFNKQGLFRNINEIENFSFIQLYGVEQLDRVFHIMYDKKLMKESVSELSVMELAEIIVSTYNEKWIKLFDFMQSEKLGVSHETLTSGTITNTETVTNKVSAFNDDELSVNDSNETTNTQKTDNRVTVQDVNILNEQYKRLSSNFCISVVCEDVKYFILLSIY